MPKKPPFPKKWSNAPPVVMANINFFVSIYIDIFTKNIDIINTYRYFFRNKESRRRQIFLVFGRHCRVRLPAQPPIFTSVTFSTSTVNMMGWWRGGGVRRVCGDWQILKVISVDVGPRIDVFFLCRRAWLVSDDEKGASAEDKNIDILRKNIDT